jgi:hypothetical protein
MSSRARIIVYVSLASVKSTPLDKASKARERTSSSVQSCDAQNFSRIKVRDLPKETLISKSLECLTKVDRDNFRALKKRTSVNETVIKRTSFSVATFMIGSSNVRKSFGTPSDQRRNVANVYSLFLSVNRAQKNTRAIDRSALARSRSFNFYFRELPNATRVRSFQCRCFIIYIYTYIHIISKTKFD